MLRVDQKTVEDMVNELISNVNFAEFAGRSGETRIYGVPRGGIPIAYMIQERIFKARVIYDQYSADVIVDDIIDSGATKAHYSPNKPFFALFDKQNDIRWKDQWLVMPWETNGEADASGHDIVTRLFQYIGEDPKREGLKETPARFLNAWKEWASGYGADPSEVLKSFEDGATGYDEMVIVHNIPVISKCEHHLADIIGHAHVGYIPNGKIVGLSKLARVVDIYARRLQVQERLTVQIADAIVKHLDPKGVGVVIRASHGCMSTRGVRVHGNATTTSAIRGVLFEKPEARKEFFDLCKMAEDAK
jgi:GTP cyclohydrolase IA